jgi:hypothetical protein
VKSMVKRDRARVNAYQCLVCGKRFSETVGTPLFGLKTPMRTVCIALNELAEGLGVRAVARIHHVKPDTVLDWLHKAGQHCEAVSAVERMNLTLRHLVSRLHRKTLCLSKKRAYLKYHLHLAPAYYHFVRYHSSLRVWLPQPIPTRGNGSPKKWEQRTPAMAAGLTDHAWSLEKLLMCHVPAPAGQTLLRHRIEERLTGAGFASSPRGRRAPRISPIGDNALSNTPLED